MAAWVLPAITTAASIWGGMKGSSKGMPGQIIKLPQYEFDEPRRKVASDFVQSNIEALGRGEEMPWMRDYMGTVQNNMQDALKKRYQGWGSQKGLYQTAMETGAVSGLGQKSVNAQVSKQALDYQTFAQEIDTEIAKIKAEIQANASTQMPQLSNQMIQGPQTAVMNGVPGQSADWGGIASNLGSMWANAYPGTTQQNPNQMWQGNNPYTPPPEGYNFPDYANMQGTSPYSSLPTGYQNFPQYRSPYASLPTGYQNFPQNTPSMWGNFVSGVNQVDANFNRNIQDPNFIWRTLQGR